MDSSKLDHHLGKKKMKAVKKEEAAVTVDEADDGVDDEDDEKIKRAAVVASGGGSGKKGPAAAAAAMRCCQAEKCTTDLREARQYHRRHKVCEQHAKAQVVLVAGFRQRFCQQCSRFHELLEFDDTKRSCRRRLAGHNERRRKNSGSDSQIVEGSSSSTTRKAGTGSSNTMNEMVCGQVDDRGRIQISIQENAAYKNFQIRRSLSSVNL